MSIDAYRRWLGGLLAAGLGLIYGLVSQVINHVVLPGIPYYQPPLGAALNIGLIIAVFATLGLVSAWSSSSIPAVFWASAAGSLLMQISTFSAGFSDAQAAVARPLLVAMLFLPLTAMLAIPFGIFRRVLNRQEEARADGTPLRARARWPLALCAALAGLGLISLYPPDGREALLKMNDLIQTGLKAADESGLPAPLRPSDVNGFLARASVNYTLEWTKGDLTRFAIPYPASREGEMSVAIARFEDGWMVACLFVAAESRPECRDYTNPF